MTESPADHRDGDGDGDGEGDERIIADPEVAGPVIDTFERLAERYGLNRSCGRIYGICYFAQRPLSLDEIVSASGYAKSTVSTATQTLSRLSLLSRRSGVEGGQRVYFTAETDGIAVVRELIGRHVMRDIRDLIAAIESVDGRPASDADVGNATDDPLADLRNDAERIGALAERLAGLSEEEIDSLLEDGQADADRRPSPGFYPRWNR